MALHMQNTQTIYEYYQCKYKHINEPWDAHTIPRILQKREKWFSLISIVVLLVAVTIEQSCQKQIKLRWCEVS